MTKRRARLYWLLLFLAALGIATALVLMALQNNLSYFRSPTEVVSGAYPEKSTGRAFRLGGLVERGSLKQDKNSNITFRVTDLQNEVSVTYHGVVPDLFREGQGVVAEGKMNEQNILVATKLLAKHDEKYMPPEVARALKPKSP